MNEFWLGMTCGGFIMTIVLNELVRRAVFDVLWLTVQLAIVLATFFVRVTFATGKAIRGAVEIFVDEMIEREPPDSFFDKILIQTAS